MRLIDAIDLEFELDNGAWEDLFDLIHDQKTINPLEEVEEYVDELIGKADSKSVYRALWKVMKKIQEVEQKYD